MVPRATGVSPSIHPGKPGKVALAATLSPFDSWADRGCESSLSKDTDGQEVGKQNLSPNPLDSRF